MNSKDKIIEYFFQKMKEQDMGLKIPFIPMPMNTKKNNWKKNNELPLSIAASILLFLVAYFIYFSNSYVSEYTIEIILEDNSSSITESLVTNSASIDMWESPTQSLIEDF